MMVRARDILAAAVIAAGLTGGGAVSAQTVITADQPDLQGLWLTTPYPAVTERVGDDIRLDLSLQNKNLPPARVEFGVTGLPDGWTYEIDGGGKAVAAAMVQPDATQGLTLKITPPKDARTGNYAFTVTGRTDGETLQLPVALTLSEAKPASVTLTPKLPALRGSPTSAFEFDVDLKNEGAADETYNLLAQAPPGFDASFKEQYGTQELTSIPVKAGETKSLKLSVKPPSDVAAGQYEVDAAVASPSADSRTKLMMVVTGQPQLALGGPEGRLSGDATAGQERTFKFTLHNAGSAPAKDVAMSASPPSGWKVTFDPEKIDAVEPNQDVDVSVSMTPSDKAIAGDYVVNVRANGEGASDSASFRVTVLTSTLWGIVGLIVIGAAVIVLAVAVTRYGRR